MSRVEGGHLKKETDLQRDLSESGERLLPVSLMKSSLPSHVMNITAFQFSFRLSAPRPPRLQRQGRVVENKRHLGAYL